MRRKLSCILAAFLVLVLAGLPALAAEEQVGSAAITLQKRAQDGKSVELIVSLADMPVYDDLGIEFVCDSDQLTLQAGEWLLPGENCLWTVDAENNLAAWTGPRIEAVNGEALKVKFDAENVEPGTEVSVSCIITAKANGSEVTRLESDTSFAVYMPGDINGDGKVNAVDPAILKQYLAHWNVYCVEDALDVDGNGKVNAVDAARLMQYLAHWNVEIF